MIGAQSPEGWAAIAAGMTAGLIGIGLIFAWRQVGEARRLREAQVRPSVVVDFEAESSFIQLTIENVGLLPALDVKLSFDPPLRSTIKDPWPPEGSTLMTRGIPTLPPGKKYRFFFDSFPARVEAKLPLTYEAQVKYKAFGRKAPFDEPYTLDLSFLMKTGEIRRKTLHDLTEVVEKLSQAAGRWTDHGDGIRVYALDRSKYVREERVSMAIGGVIRKREDGETEDVREALTDALRQAGENASPPERWVAALEAGETRLTFDVEELDEDH